MPIFARQFFAMTKHLLSLCIICAPVLLFAQNYPPTITQLSANPDWGNMTLTVNYEVADPENDPLDISVQFSNDGGKTYNLTGSVPASGDVGFPIMPGSRSISCDIAALSNMSGAFTLRLIADDKQPFDLQALVNAVDSNAMRSNLEFVEGIRHRTTGAAHLTAVRDSLKNLFLASQLHYQEQAVPFGAYSGRNLIGSLPGTVSPDKVVVNDAHYDTVNNAPGADDNGSGVVGVMEGVRLLSRYPFKKSLRFIGFDLEESGLLGSIRYVSSGIPAGEDVIGVFNYEMIGYWSDEPNTQTLPQGFPLIFPDAAAQVAANQYRGDFLSNVGNTNSQPLALLYSSSAQQYVPGLKVITLDVPGNGQIAPDLRRSDHAPFWDAGKQALMLTDGANFRNECYHTPGDTLNEKLNFTFMSNVVKAAIAAMAQLAEIQHGHWATASFQGKVGSNEPAESCVWKVFQAPDQNGAFSLLFDLCEEGDHLVSLFDLKGTKLLQQNVQARNGEPVAVALPAIPSGFYVLQCAQKQGASSKKVWLNGRK
jgi:hypothetical protein